MLFMHLIDQGVVLGLRCNASAVKSRTMACSKTGHSDEASDKHFT